MPSPWSLRSALGTPAARVGGVLAIAGAACTLTTTLAAAAGGPAGLPAVLAFGAWALVPYLLLLLFGLFVRNPWLTGGAGALTLAGEIGIRAGVFLFPRGSTAALALIFSPVWLSAIGLPLGAALGWLCGRLWRSGLWGARALAGLAASSVLGLVVLGLARPELFPTAVVARRRALERIGPPRVVAGGASFETVVLSSSAAWPVVAELDGKPGDEVALVTHTGALLLDPVRFEPEGRLELGGDGRFWQWHSRLARLGGRVVVVQTGGGYSPTEVRELDGTLAWSYRPNPELSPSALRAADLDGDGATELYASWNEALVRLDGSGREVWSRPTRMASLFALAPRRGSAPALLATTEFGRGVTLWSEAGESLATLPISDRDAPLAIVDFPAARGVAIAGASLRVVDPLGRTTFEHPLDGLRATGAASFRAAAGAPPLLAVVSMAGRDVPRSRLVLLDAAGHAVYDEVFERVPTLFEATRADGGETLLLWSDAVRALRARPARRAPR